MWLTDHFNTITGSTGRWLLTKLDRVSGQAAFFWVCLKVFLRYRIAGRRLVGRIMVEQIYYTGVQSIELAGLVALLAGAVLTFRTILLLEAVGNLDGLATVLITSIVREGGPLLTAMIIVLRSGSAIAMEIGYMKVLGEIEGVEMQGIPIVHFLFIPRLVGVAVSVMCLMVIFDVIGVVGGLFASWTVMDVTAWDYFYRLGSTLKYNDFLMVLTKGLCFGVIIPVVCMHDGFQAQKAITSVPPMVSRALVDCLIYVVLFNILISATMAMLS